jgi:hypothetical protein
MEEKAYLTYCNKCNKTLIDYNHGDQPKLLIPAGTEETVLIQDDEGDYFWVCPSCKSNGNLEDLHELKKN